MALPHSMRRDPDLEDAIERVVLHKACDMLLRCLVSGQVDVSDLDIDED